MEKRTQLWHDSIRERDPTPHLLDNWVSPVSNKIETNSTKPSHHLSLIDQYSTDTDEDE